MTLPMRERPHFMRVGQWERIFELVARQRLAAEFQRQHRALLPSDNADAYGTVGRGGDVELLQRRCRMDAVAPGRALHQKLALDLLGHDAKLSACRKNAQR